MLAGHINGSGYHSNMLGGHMHGVGSNYNIVGRPYGMWW